ncbi:hypothetical protein RvY_06876 [Ramazzottius varieornatus]|uniref:Peptidase A1 domain-containing protein n=1 Tax=Ramazzottius varieornatus TaxID=947166 RepID=A0A1D1V8S3_RAMVA|nr:hypothetical protein RvY_06876 [Ramazzottius varieornatus]
MHFILSIILAFTSLLQCQVHGSTFEEFQPAWREYLEKSGLGRSQYAKQADIFINPQPSSNSLSLIPAVGGVITSEVTCGKDNRNFCTYPELPFIESLNVPAVLANPNRLNRLPSGKCPVGYTKFPTFDCLNIAAAFIEVSCCVYNSPPVTLADYCSKRTQLLFTASFELCDGRSFLIAGSNAWQVNDNFKILGGPYSLSVLTGGTVSGGVDSAFVDSSCNVGFFQGTALKWMNFPGKTASANKQLTDVLGPLSSANCGAGALSCVPTKVNFAVCPNAGSFCLISVALASNLPTVNRMFFVTPGFSSFVLTGVNQPGIAVNNINDLQNRFSSFISATYIKSTNRLAFVDGNNDVYYYDTTGKLLSGPTNLFDLFGTCGFVGSNQAPIIYIPYPIAPIFANGTPVYGNDPAYQNYSPPSPNIVSYLPPPPPPQNQGYDNYPVNYRAATTAPPTYNPPPPPQYQAPPPQQYQAPQPQYPLPPPPQYQTPSPMVYQTPAPPVYRPPAPTYPPTYSPAPPVYQTPAPQYAPPTQYSPPPAPAPAPQYGLYFSSPRAVAATPSAQPKDALSVTPAANSAKLQVVIAESPITIDPSVMDKGLQNVNPTAPPASQDPPQGPPIRPRPEINQKTRDETMFVPPFKAPKHEFFDVSAFVRKGDIEKFQPVVREVKLV